ncbi:MAG: MFS transporter [Gemmatimonadota bacterium]|nr:MFS transporter [Gemmatimonadota bacterium]
MARPSRRFRGEPPLLAYGASFALFSSFGQTFLISLFVPSFVSTFDLSDGGFGGLYSAATLISAALLPWAGRRLDYVRLNRFSLAVVALMTASALMLALAPNAAVLGIALVGLRLAGQGLSGHTTHTVMARYAGARRGWALSVAGLGFPAGEAVLPYLTTVALLGLGWRVTWLVFAALAFVVFAPLLVAVLHRAEIELDPKKLDEHADEGPSPGKREFDARAGDWTRAAVLRDRRFFHALPSALLPSFWLTGIFLYQTRIAEMKGWPITLMATAFVGFAASRIAFSLLAGRVVDRLTARRVYPFLLLPMAAALALPLAVDARWGAFGLMIGLGVTMGMGTPVRSSLWAELYGVRHLGAIKAMITSFSVLAAAGSPVLIGLALDADVALDHILWTGVATTLAGSAVAWGLMVDSNDPAI